MATYYILWRFYSYQLFIVKGRLWNAQHEEWVRKPRKRLAENSQEERKPQHIQNTSVKGCVGIGHRSLTEIMKIMGKWLWRQWDNCLTKWIPWWSKHNKDKTRRPQRRTPKTKRLKHSWQQQSGSSLSIGERSRKRSNGKSWSNNSNSRHLHDRPASTQIPIYVKRDWPASTILWTGQILHDKEKAQVVRLSLRIICIWLLQPLYRIGISLLFDLS